MTASHDATPADDQPAPLPRRSSRPVPARPIPSRPARDEPAIPIDILLRIRRALADPI